MYIKSLNITNYKSFVESEEIEFSENINLITGINNSGKTSLLETISCLFGNNHNKFSMQSINSNVEVCYFMKGYECRDYFERGFILPKEIEGSLQQPNEIMNKFALAIEHYLEIKAKFYGTSSDNTTPFEVSYSFGDTASVKFSKNGRENFWKYQNGSFSIDKNEKGGLTTNQIIQGHLRNTFRFDAIRPIKGFEISDKPVLEKTTLESNCTNLPTYLGYLNAYNSPRFSRIIKEFQRIFPSVQTITFESNDYFYNENYKTNTSIQFWFHDVKSENPELSIPASDTGTGLTQALALLTVILETEHRTILIDEPNSFLHPQAIKQLLRIIKENPQHQYFITTHSNEIFAEIRPEFFFRLSYDHEVGSKVEKIAYGEIGRVYQELGYSPFFEKTLWVEGPTEIQSFPIILQDPTIQFHSLVIGDITSNKSHKKEELDRILRIYDLITKATSGSFTTPKLKILIDQEHLPNIKDYEKRKDTIRFLPMKMFENYLIDEAAIFSVLNKNCEKYEVDLIKPENLKNKLKEIKYQPVWKDNEDGAKLLEQLFSELTESKISFDKTTHSVELTRWLVEHKPDVFSDLKEIVNQFLES